MSLEQKLKFGADTKEAEAGMTGLLTKLAGLSGGIAGVITTVSAVALAGARKMYDDWQTQIVSATRAAEGMRTVRDRVDDLRVAYYSGKQSILTFNAHLQEQVALGASVAEKYAAAGEMLKAYIRLQNEAIDVQMAADVEKVRGNRNLTPAQQTLAIAAIHEKARQAKSENAAFEQRSELGRTQNALEDAQRRAKKEAGDLPAAQKANDQAAAELAASKTRAKTTAEAFGPVEADYRRRIATFRDEINDLALHKPTRATDRIRESAERHIARLEAKLAPIVAMRTAETLDVEGKDGIYDRAKAHLSTITKELEKHTLEAEKLTRQLEIQEKIYERTERQRRALEPVRHATAMGAATREATDQTRALKLSQLQDARSLLESGIRGYPTPEQAAQRHALNMLINEQEHPFGYQQGSKRMKAAQISNEERKQFYDALDPLFRQMGPAAWRLRGQPPAAGPAVDLPAEIKRIQSSTDATGKQLSDAAGAAAASMSRMGDAVTARLEELRTIAENVAHISRTS